MKIFKHKNIMGMIYGIVLAIPLLSILVRSAYVVVNKNAKDSYSGSVQYQYTSNEVNTIDDIVLGNIYCLEFDTTISADINTHLLYSDNTSLTTSNYEIVKYETDSNNISYRKYPNVVWDFIRFNTSSPTSEIIFKGDSTDDQSFFSIIPDNLNEYHTKIYLIMNALPNSESIQYIHESDYLGDSYVINGGTLDNAFDSSLSKYVDENSFGKLNFFEWFFDIFMDSNQQNNLYIRYVNWYMNYVLLVSCSYILFLVLMWFVNYSRRILERGLDYDW